MISRIPEVSAEQIHEWIVAGARDSARGHDPAGAGESSLQVPKTQSSAGARLKAARGSLQRAEAKNFGKLPKALRWIRRNQGGVNDALIHSLRSMISLNREMNRDLEDLAKRVADLEADAVGRATQDSTAERPR